MGAAEMARDGATGTPEGKGEEGGQAAAVDEGGVKVAVVREQGEGFGGMRLRARKGSGQGGSSP